MKKLYLGSLIANGVLFLSIILLFAYFPSCVKSRVERAKKLHYERKTSLFEALPNDKNEIIFVGGSLIEGANWAEMFHKTTIKNRGIMGDDIQGVLNRMDEILASKPAKIFLMIGQEDLAKQKSADKVVNDYMKILQKCREKSPQSRLYIHTLTPVLYELKGKNLKNEEIMIFNGKLKPLAQKYETYYIDLFTSLVGNKETNEIDARYTNDGEHLTAAGYTRWKALIEQYVND